jgi:hypothetical protein
VSDFTSFNCWKCGATNQHVPIPLSRTEICAQCRADLHVCRQCQFYDTAKASACQEPVADHVSDKTRANFCGYLSINTDPFHGDEQGSANVDALGALFGIDNALDSASPSSAEKAQDALEDLFGITPKDTD